MVISSQADILFYGNSTHVTNSPIRNVVVTNTRSRVMQFHVLQFHSSLLGPSYSCPPFSYPYFSRLTTYWYLVHHYRFKQLSTTVHSANNCEWYNISSQHDVNECYRTLEL